MMIAGACLLGAIAGLVVSARRPTLYQASTTVLVQQAASGEAFSTARALLRNYTLASETVTEVGLASAPYHMTAQAFVNDSLVVEESGGTHLLNVKVRLADPALAAKASYLLSTKAVQLNRQVATEGNRAVRDQLKVLLDDASHRLDAAEQELLAARTQARLELAKKDAELMLDGRGEAQQIAAQIASEKGRLAAAEEELTHHQPVLTTPRAPRAEEALRQSEAAQRRAEDSQQKLEDARKAEEARKVERPARAADAGAAQAPRAAEAPAGGVASPTTRRTDTADLDALPDSQQSVRQPGLPDAAVSNRDGPRQARRTGARAPADCRGRRAHRGDHAALSQRAGNRPAGEQLRPRQAGVQRSRRPV